MNVLLTEQARFSGSSMGLGSSSRRDERKIAQEKRSALLGKRP
jgi:hypothetical protein